MTTSRLRMLALVAPVALVAAACGGGGSSTKATPTTVKLTPQQIFQQGQPATVELHGKQGKNDVGGTGVIFDAQKGLVLTNAHVVSGVAALKARINEQTEVPARVLGTSPCDDVAVVQLVNAGPGLRAATLGSSAGVRNQDNVVALGYPASFADFTKEKLVSTNGSVQSPNIAAEPDPSLPKYPSLIQHSATINPGNSGGPLLNEQAQVVGINTLSNTGTTTTKIQGQYYAIAIDRIKPMLPDLTAGKSTANMGWDMAPFSEVPLSQVFEATGYGTAQQGQAADKLLADNHIDGLFVFGVDPGTPAAEANIVGGELVTKLKGTPVKSVAEVCDILQSASPNETLEVTGRYLIPDATSGHSFGEQWTDKVTVKT